MLGFRDFTIYILFLMTNEYLFFMTNEYLFYNFDSLFCVPQLMDVVLLFMKELVGWLLMDLFVLLIRNLSKNPFSFYFIILRSNNFCLNILILNIHYSIVSVNIKKRMKIAVRSVIYNFAIFLAQDSLRFLFHCRGF